jgi:hypothetical protein
LKRHLGWLAAVAASAFVSIAVSCGGPPFSAAAGDGGAPGDADARALTDAGAGDGRQPLDATLDSSVGPDSTATTDDAPSEDVFINLDARPDIGVADGGCNCLPPVSGWNGPGEVWVDLYGALSPSCASFTGQPPFMGYLGLQHDDSCSCSCGEPTGQGCASSITVEWGTAGCNGLGGPQTLSASCSKVSALAATNVSVTATLPTSQGACAPDASGPADASWKYAMAACPVSSLDAGTCSPGNVCVPSPDQGFMYLCVWRGAAELLADGGEACPPQYSYPLDIAPAGTKLEDHRSCSTSCSCGPAQGSSCPVTLELGNGTCPPTGTTVTNTSCLPVSGQNMAAVVESPTPGSCAATAGTATGGITKDNPTRFCCTTPAQ